MQPVNLNTLFYQVQILSELKCLVLKKEYYKGGNYEFEFKFY